MLVAPPAQDTNEAGHASRGRCQGQAPHLRGRAGGTTVTIRLHDRSLHWKLLLNPRLVVGEAYMDGHADDGGRRGPSAISCTWSARTSTSSTRTPSSRPATGSRNGSARCSSTNPIGRAQRNVAHHYDLSDDLYELFLDPDRQYSCAYFDTPNHSLEQAQHAKKRHLASKLLLDRPGLSVLDIGSGWGGLGIYLHKEAGATVTGLTLSREQQAYATERAQALGIQDQVGFHLRDYREDTGTYDRIVSVGMFEHVGVKHYVEFFRKVERLLKEDGVALLHTIARWDGPSVTNPWLRKYIFPGGYCPSLSEVFARAGTDRPEIPRRGDAAAPLRRYAQALVAQLPGQPRAG